MVSFEVRQTLKTTARSLMLAAVAAPFSAYSQPDFDRAANDAQQQLVEEIQEAQSQEGIRSPEQIEPLTALALLYEESGDHSLAAAAIERARDLVRVNYGLHSFDQAPLIQQLILNEEARGDLATALVLEDELLNLAGRHPNDLRTVAIFREIADKRIDLLRRFLAGEFPPEIYGSSGMFALYGRAVIRSILTDAQWIYGEAVAVLLRNELYSSDELRELEMELVRSSDLIRHHDVRTAGRIDFGHLDLDLAPGCALCVQLWQSHINTLWDLVYSNHGLAAVEKRRERVSRVGSQYQLGRESLLRLAAYYDVADSTPWLTVSGPWRSRIDAFIQIADWDLLYSINGGALEEYQQVYDLLNRIGVPQASIDEIFSPKIPVVLPTFLPNPLTSKSQESTGYIDVAFEVTKYGESRQIEVLDTTANATDAAKDSLVDLIRRSRFRSRVTDGQFARTPPIVVRYYLKE